MEREVESALATEKPNAERFRGAYEALAARISAVTVRRAVNVRWIHAYGVVGRACRDLIPYRAELLRVGAGFDIRVVDELPLLADAFVYTCTCAPEPQSVKRRHEELAAAIALRRKLQLAIELFRLSGREVPDFRGKLSTETGFEDVASDLVRLSLLVQAADSTDAAELSPAEREGAVAIALRLLSLSNQREEDARAVLEAVSRKQQAFALLYEAYTEVRETMRFILRKQPGMLERVIPALLSGPQLHAQRTSRRDAPVQTVAGDVAERRALSADWWED